MRHYSWQLGMALLALGGCTNFSTLQTARVIPPGTARLGVGGGFFRSDKFNAVIKSAGNTASTSGTPLSFPYAEAFVRLGVASRTDLGVRYTLPGTVSGDVKYQLLDAGPFALAAGAGVGYLPITVNGQTTHLADLMVPVYASVDIEDWVGLYTGARYVARFQTGQSSSTHTFWAASVGLRLGNRSGLLGEVTYLRQIGGDFDAFQFGGALFFGRPPSVPEPPAPAATAKGRGKTRRARP